MKKIIRPPPLKPDIETFLTKKSIQPIILTTAPGYHTHWQQSLIHLPKTYVINKNGWANIKLTIKPLEENKRELSCKLEFKVGSIERGTLEKYFRDYYV